MVPGQEAPREQQGSLGAGCAGAADAFARELARAVADEIEARSLGAQPEPGPILLDRRGIAEALGVCVDVVDRLRREGCPELTVGDVPRFELDRVLAWLRARGAK